MDDTQTTTVNIKSIRMDAWDRAKAAAGRNDETLGSWVSRACDQLAAAEASGARLYPPDKPANPTEADLAQCRHWAEVLVTMHNAGATAPEWLSRGVFRKAADALGIERPAPRKPPLRLSGPQ